VAYEKKTGDYSEHGEKVGCGSRQASFWSHL
jgi:hypothetical protein